jgi:hypothetical protein
VSRSCICLCLFAPLHFEPLFWEERFDWARRCPRAPPGAPKYLIPLVFDKSEGGQACVCLGLFGVFSAGIRGIYGLEVERGRLQRSGEAYQAFLSLFGDTNSSHPEFLIFKTEG